MGKIPIGETVELNPDKLNLSRRRFGEYLGLLAVGSISLSTMVTKVAGEEPEGEPLLQVVNFDGTPAQVKIIPPARKQNYNRIEGLSTETFTEIHSGIIAITPETIGEYETDLGLKFTIDEDHDKADQTDEIEAAVDDLPTKFEYKPRTEGTPHTNTEGGSRIVTNRPCYTDINHTCMLIGESQLSGYNDILICTYHAIDGWCRDETEIIDDDNNVIGDLIDYDEHDYDWAAFELRDGVNADLWQTRHKANDIVAAWTGNGIDEEGPIDITGSGQVSGAMVGTAVDYHLYLDVGWIQAERQVELNDEISEEGDSGGPVAEVTNDYLVNAVLGVYDGYTHGTVGLQMCNRLDIPGVH